MCRLDSSDLGSATGFSEHGNRPSGFVIGEELRHKLSGCCLLKKNSASWC